MTTANDRESEIAALAVGAVDCIAKPFNPPLVQARVNTQLRLRRQTIELNKLTNRDALTGLFNRHHFDVALDSEFERHRRQQTSLAIALLDVDYFQAFNDSYGQPGCDRCLQQIGAVIKFAACRPGEAAARIDGEEFALLLPNHTANIAKAHGERLCAKIAALQIPHTQSSVKNIVTVSVGIAARVPNADDTPQLLINAADRALYQAKSNGHNQVVIADLL